MNRGRAVILNPSLPESVKRREFLLDSLRRSKLDYVETVEESRIIVEWQGVPVPERRAPARKSVLPSFVTVERAMRERFNCSPDDVEYWDEMIRLASERQGLRARTLTVRAGETTRETWGVEVGEHLAVNRVKDSWAVTHIGTGLVVTRESTFHAALALARNAATWPEWAAIRSRADVTPEFRQKARAAFGEVAA